MSVLLDSDDEEWREIERYSRYLISDHGRIWDRKIDRVKLCSADYMGRRRVRLKRDDGVLIQCIVHRIVASTFLELPCPASGLHRWTVVFIDGDRGNLHAGNLVWTKDRHGWRRY